MNVIDKKREGSKTVIVRGKEFTKRAMEGSREKRRVVGGVFYTLQPCYIRPEGTGGRKKEGKRLSVWRFHIPALLLLACFSLSCCCCRCCFFLVCFPSPAADSAHVISSSVLFMKEKREDMKRTLAEGKEKKQYL